MKLGKKWNLEQTDIELHNSDNLKQVLPMWRVNVRCLFTYSVILISHVSVSITSTCCASLSSSVCCLAPLVAWWSTVFFGPRWWRTAVADGDRWGEITVSSTYIMNIQWFVVNMFGFRATCLNCIITDQRERLPWQFLKDTPVSRRWFCEMPERNRGAVSNLSARVCRYISTMLTSSRLQQGIRGCTCRVLNPHSSEHLLFVEQNNKQRTKSPT